MPTLTPDNIGDYEMPDDRLNTAVTHAEREAWERIRGNIGFFRNQYMFLKRGLKFQGSQESAPFRAYKDNPEQFHKSGVRPAWLRESVDESTLRNKTKFTGDREQWYKAFSANGVSEGNVQTALEFAKGFPDKISALLAEKGDKDIDKTIIEIKGKRDVVGYLDALRSMSFERPEIGYAKLMDELSKVKNDLRWAGDPTKAKKDLDSTFWHSIETDYPTTWTQDDRNAAMKELREEKAKLLKFDKQYTTLISHLSAIFARYTEQAPESLASFFDASTKKIVPAMLDNSIHPKELADRLVNDLQLKSKEEYNQEIKELEKKRDEQKKGSNAKTGREAVLAVYAKYFEVKQKLSPDQARKAAQELYGRNAMGKQEVKLQKQMVRESREVLPDYPLGFWQERGKDPGEVFTGSEEDFVAHIAESPQVGLMPSGTRRLGVLYRKAGARPSWGKLGYPHLITAYFAIRNAERQGRLRNSRYVRNQLDEVGRLLMSYHVKNLVRDIDSAEMEDEARKKLEQSVDETTRVRSQIRLFLSGDVPPAYAGDVTSAIAFAVNKTAWKRRAVGRSIKRAAGWTIGTGSVYNPVTWPGKMVRGTWGVVVAAKKKTTSGIGNAWNYLFHQKSRIV